MLCNAVRRAALRGGSAPIIPTDGLILDYSFDAISGSTIIDGAGNYNGTIYGATSITGLHGNALSFDGVNDYVLIPGTKTPFATLSALSISLLMKINYSSSSEFASVVGNLQNGYVSGSGRDYQGFGLQIFSSSGVPSIRWFGFGDNNNAAVNVNIPENTWMHIVCIWDGHGIWLVIDNVPTARTALSINDPSGREELYIGKLPYNALYAGCTVDNLRFYNRVLTTAEIAELYKEL